MTDSVLYEVDEGLATVTLNRPESMNALDTGTKDDLRDALRAAGSDEAVRAVLLTGAGPRLLRRPGPQGAHRRSWRPAAA